MGKKSRMKQQRRQVLQDESATHGEQVHEAKPKGLEVFLLWIIYLGTAAALFTPLVLHSRFYFPFVGPKGLYLMGFCQIVFFAWLFLALHYKKYRPGINYVLTAFIFFLIILILSSLFGVDFSRSFWSKFERMTGLLMWLHLFGWFLAISSTFKKPSNWRGIFWVTCGIGTLIALISAAAEVGIVVYERGGSALGNSSFLGTYLLFHVFIALYLFFKEKNKYLKIFALAASVLCGLGLYYAGARAATLGMIGGLGLIGLFYFSFKVKKKAIRITACVTLALVSVAVFIAIILLLVPGNFVSNKFVELTTASRIVNWQMAWKGFLEKPLLGWGPENYTVLFPKFFNPCLFTPKCGTEIWFDRTHNIIFDTLATTGILGLIAYIGLFVTMIYVLFKKYFKEKSIEFWTFSIFSALLIGYFIQNLTVFDMPATLMLFILTISFTASVASEKNSKFNKIKPPKFWIAILLGFVFLVTFFEFVIQPAKTDIFVINAVVTEDPNVRLEYYKKTFEASSLGKYQIRDFFAQHSQEFVRENLDSAPKDILAKELDFIIEELKKSRQESPLDFRSVLKLAQTYNLYALIDGSKMALAEESGKEALALSPANQQAYWTLAQTKIYQGEYETALELVQKAIDLEPEHYPSYEIAIQVAQKAGQSDRVKEIAQKAIEINPDWITELGDIINPVAEQEPSE